MGGNTGERTAGSRPAARRVARLVEGVPDGGGQEALGWPTPCERYTVGDLLDHIEGAAIAFRAAAVKQPLDAAASGDASNLGDDWRTSIPRHLRALSEAWSAPKPGRA